MVTAADPVIPDSLAVTPTLNCAGFYWAVKGDTNGNATASVEYRKKGETSWLPAMPLMRMKYMKVDSAKNTIGGVTVVDYGRLNTYPGDFYAYIKARYELNYLAGSVVNLNKGTEYEFKLTLADPEGGGTTRMVSAITRAEPLLPPPGNTVIHVSGGGDALRTAAASGKKGQTLMVHAGVYNGPVVLNVLSATADSPFCVMAAGDGPAIIQGPTPEQESQPGAGLAFGVYRPFTYVYGFRIKSFYTGFLVQASHVYVAQCSVSGVHEGIVGTGSYGLFTDNYLKGTTFSGMDAEGMQIVGDGNVFSYNYINRFADALSFDRSSESDMHNNDVFECADDGVEFDLGRQNLRVFRNRFYFPGANGSSYQPFVGPGYVFGNIISHVWQNSMKQRYSSNGLFLVNNDMVSSDEANNFIQHVYSRNNLFFHTNTASLYSMKFRPEDVLRSQMNYDYDGLDQPANVLCDQCTDAGWTTAEKAVLAPYDRNTLPGLVTLSGQESHGFMFSLSQTVGFSTFGTDKSKPWPDFRLKAGSPAIDKGVILPNIAEDFNGAAPDAGALEYGRPLPQWGPRPPDLTLVSLPAGAERGIHAAAAGLAVHAVPGNRLCFTIDKRFAVTRADIYNVQGGKIKSLVPRHNAGPLFGITWDGTGEQGTVSPCGIYFVRARGPAGAAWAKFLKQ